MATKKPVKRYTEEFKAAALKRADDGEKVLHVAKDLKIHESLIYGWRKQRLDMAEQASGKKPDALNNVKDAVVCLKQAEDLLNKRLRAGKIKKYDRIHLRMLDALKLLTGED
jgi:transposase-like protein